jgi:hypothetical protein
MSIEFAVLSRLCVESRKVSLRFTRQFRAPRVEKLRFSVSMKCSVLSPFIVFSPAKFSLSSIAAQFSPPRCQKWRLDAPYLEPEPPLPCTGQAGPRHGNVRIPLHEAGRVFVLYRVIVHRSSFSVCNLRIVSKTEEAKGQRTDDQAKSNHSGINHGVSHRLSRTSLNELRWASYEIFVLRCGR